MKSRSVSKNFASSTKFPNSGLDRYPLELSGGQRQRVGLMRALIVARVAPPRRAIRRARSPCSGESPTRSQGNLRASSANGFARYARPG